MRQKLPKQIEVPSTSISFGESKLPWRRLCILVLLAAVALPGTWLGTRWFAAHVDREQGLEFAKRGNLSAAEPLLMAALDRSPHDLEVLKALASLEMSASKLEEAEAHLTAWCALTPDENEPFKYRMEVRWRLRQLAEAIEDAQRVLEAQPEDQKVRERLPQLLAAAGRFEEAERECRRNLASKPNDLAALCLLAAVLHERGKNPEAATILDPLLKEHPRLSPALLTRAKLYLDAGQPEKAIPLLRDVVKLDAGPQQMDALYQLSLALHRTGQVQEAEKIRAELEWQKKVEWLLFANQLDEAERLLQEVLGRDPKNVSAHRFLASCYEKRGQRDRAAEERRLAIP